MVNPPLPRIPQTGGYAMYRRRQYVIDFLSFLSLFLSAQQLHLDSAEGIDVRVAQPDGARQERIPLQKRSLSRQEEDRLPRPPEFLLDHSEHAAACGFI